MKCTYCKRKAVFESEKNPKRKFCEGHAIKYLTDIKNNPDEDFLPRIEQYMKVKA